MSKTISFTNFETDALKLFIASDDCVPLDKEHEQMCAERSAHGDSKARTELITHNMRLVVSIAKQYQGQGFVLDDLVGYGKEGLIKAVDSYNCSRGCGFASYAQYWIKSYITSKMSKDRAIHMPLKKSALRLNVLRTMAKFEAINGYRMSEYELADMLGVPVKAVLYVLNENNLAALAAALGVESVTAEEIGTTYPLKGINADGSVYDGGFTANNGYWYSLDGNVSNWAEIEAAGYLGAFIEYRGDYKFGCGMWEESGKQSTVKIGVGDAVLTFNLTVDEPKSYETEEVGTLEYAVTQTIAAGYGGEVITVDYDKVCELLGLTDETFNAGFLVLGEGGTVSYTGETPGGFWYNAAGEICGWGDDGSSMYLNVKYGDALPEDAQITEEFFVTEAGTYVAKILLANPEAKKHVTTIVTFTVTSE